MSVLRLGFLSGLAMVAFVGMFSSEIIAQDGRLIGGGSGITVFEDRNFRGDAVTYQNDMSSLPSRFNNKISSLRVGPGEFWEICDQTRYRGQCVTVSGEESDLRRNNWDNRISSMRRVTGGGGGGGWGGQTSRPPSWARGTFYALDPSTGAQITLSISDNGQVMSSSMESSSYGTYYQETIQMEGVTVRVQRAGNGIRTSRYDTGQVINYSRTQVGSGGPGWGGGGGGQTSRPPSWATGTFYALDPSTGAQITLSISNNGQVMSSSMGSSSYGTYYRETIQMEGVTVRVQRAGNGIRTSRYDTGQVINYSRTQVGSGGPGWDGGGTTRPPNWATGTFNGRDPATGANIVLTIGVDGRVTSRSGRQVSYGTFNNNMIYMEGVTVRVEQAGRNNIRTTRVDTGQVVNYRKN